jgi:hypothetical protein
VDTDTPWVAATQFDGGAVRYLHLATDEGSPYPWDAGTVWSLGCQWRYSQLPKSATLSFPASDPVLSVPYVLYDLFDRRVVKPIVEGKTAMLAVDLRLFPGRLYALAPAPLGPPALVARTKPERGLDYQVSIVDDRGRTLAARVPLRIRLAGGDSVAMEVYRGTGADGTFRGSTTVPLGGEWRLEVTELLGGKATGLSVPKVGEAPRLLADAPDVALSRWDRVARLLDLAKAAKSLHLVAPAEAGLADVQRAALADALRKRAIELKTGELPQEPAEGGLLAAGVLPDQKTMGPLLWAAWHRGGFEQALSVNVPGPGRGIVAPLFAPRGHGEHAIALVGGDAAGLAKAVSAFISCLDAPKGVLVPTKFIEITEDALDELGLEGGRPAGGIRGEPAGLSQLPRLGDLVGARLDGVTVAADGRHLLVTAKGYLRNAALVRDRGRRASVVRAVRLGQAPTVGSRFVSPDGRWFGASARVAARFGQGFHLVDARNGRTQVFASFGDIASVRNHFAVSDDGDTVVAPGTYGVVCWRRERGVLGVRTRRWREAWAIDYWKEFQRLDWPVADKKERIPQFHAHIPRGADYALILFGELTNQGWVTPDNHAKVWLAAVALADGRERWRLDVPISDTQLFPTLHTSPGGTRLLLQLQKGSWGRESFEFFAVAEGKALGSWQAKVAPLGVAVADATGRMALVFTRRLLEVRRPDGSLVHNQYWKAQPVSVAFAPDGEGLFLADDAGRLSRLDAEGRVVWQRDLGCVAQLASADGRVYAARWDGRLQAWDVGGTLAWTLDCTPALLDPDPMAAAVASAKYDGVLGAERPSTVATSVPEGENLLRSGKATLTLGGTKSWMSDGKLEVKPEELVNGQTDDVTTPWLHLDEVFWDAGAGRQVYAVIDFKQPTDVESLTVHENPAFPGSWPTEGLVQVWNEGLKQWDTARFGVFLRGPVATYPLGLKGVTRLRYVPWKSYYRNFHTSEIEVR